jgi:hypothetical protein
LAYGIRERLSHLAARRDPAKAIEPAKQHA